MLPMRIIVVGGTIDAEKYDENEGRVISFGQPSVEDILKIGRVRIPYKRARIPLEDEGDIVVLDQIDSLDMTDRDRIKILLFCLLDDKKRILITHGTDKAVETGLLLKEHIRDKTIVITGAMKPHQFSRSDAAFNVGGAIIACQTLPYGVYIVMQGQVFPVENVKKVKEMGDAYFQEGSLQQPAAPIEAVNSLGRRINEVLAKGQWTKKHIEVMPVCVPMKTKLEEFRDLQGIKVKEAYYTASYDEESFEFYFGPVNHEDTLVCEGKFFGIKGDTLIRTGNPILRLEPEVLRIIKRIEMEDVIVFFVEELKEKERKQILSKTGVEKKYRENEELFGGKMLHPAKRILRFFWDGIFKK